jgi:hypothetical protein
MPNNQMANPNVGTGQVQLEIREGDNSVSPGTSRMGSPNKHGNESPDHHDGPPGAAGESARKRAQSKIMVDPEHDKTEYSQLVEYIKRTHPRNKREKGYSCGEACGYTTGWHACCGTSKKSDLDQFGVGVVLYFRFVKYMIGFFFLFSLLQLPALYFSIQSSLNFTSGASDYKTALYYTTLGSIGRGATQCKTPMMNENISFSCESGTLGRLSALEYGFVVEPRNITCSLYTFFSWTPACNKANIPALNTAYSVCEGQKSCSFVVDPAFFDFTSEECQGYQTAGNSIYVRALCDNIELKAPGGKAVSKEVVGYILAGCDAVMALLFFIMILSLKSSEKKTAEAIYGNINAVEDFSIQVTHLPNIGRDELKHKLWEKFSKVKMGKKTTENLVVSDIQFAEPQTLLNLKVRLGVLRKKRLQLARKFYRKYAKINAVVEVGMEDIEVLAKETGNKKAKKSYKKIEKVKIAEVKIEQKIKNIQNNKGGIVAAYITFEDKSQNDKALYAYQDNPCSKCCYSICCCCYGDNPHILDKKYIKVGEAPAPSNITWSNMDASGKERLIRRGISWIITICLWAVTIAFITYIKNEQTKLAEHVKPTQDCSVFTGLTQADAEADKAKGPDATGALECFCRADVKRQVEIDVCRDWAIDTYLNKSLPFLIVFAIIFTNLIMQFIFRALASFEKHRNATSELSSRVMKIFIAQFLNTGIIILIVNTRFTRKPIVEFLNGTFDDFIPEWYLNVGTTLLMTMLINVVTLPIINLTILFLKGIGRCCDRRCKCDKRVTKKKTQSKWNQLYTGPDFMIDLRYSQILNVVFICLLYGSGLPLLFVSTFLNLNIIYWLDKFFLLKICKNPKNFDDKLEISVRRVLYLMLVIHLAVAVWVYGNPLIFGSLPGIDTDLSQFDILQQADVPYVFYTIYKRAIKWQTVPLSIMFIILVVAIFATLFLKNTLGRLCMVCCPKRMKRTKDSKYKTYSKYYDLIKRTDLPDELHFAEQEAADCQYPELNGRLNDKVSRLSHLVQHSNPTTTFQGDFSYRIGQNPTYKEYLKIKGMKK